jgi:hypothetical protein
MNDREEAVYWELSARAERGGLPTLPGPDDLRGAAAAEAGGRDLMWATDTATVEDALTAARRGRPRLGPGAGRSPVVRARLSTGDFESLEHLSTHTGRSVSDLVREGVKRVLADAAAS